MRLGQLARKLAIKPVAIVDFLAQHNIRIDEEGNTKLEDDHVVLILQQFASAPVVAPKAKETALESLTVNPAAIENKSSGEIEIPVTEIIEEEKIELIKAPKVELSGLKVLGKIDLPEPKKKETPPDTQEASASAEPEKQSQPDSRKPYPQRRERSNPPSRKNPIAQQREHEAMESRKKREAGLELEKEKRTLHYLKRVNVTQPAKAIKIVHDEPAEELSVVADPAPKTWWGRFIKWLNS